MRDLHLVARVLIPGFVVPDVERRPLRLGFCRTSRWDQVDAEVACALEQATDQLRSAGHYVSELELPDEFAAVFDDHQLINDCEGARSLAKELRSGGTLQLIYVGEGAEDQLEGPLRFFLSPKSAFVSGQVIRLTACGKQVTDWTRPLAGRKALVTGAARGIGASIAETLARDGADVILLDVPPAKSDLEALAARLGARSITLDICAEDAAAQLIEQLPDGLDILVHNAGITRDKTLANMTPEFWDAVLAVNLNAPQVLTKALLDSGTLHDDARVVLLASISGIAGNRGQTNYAASKAGLIGLAQAWAPTLQERGISINAVAPGFIETQMTAHIPFGLREAGRRMSSLGQGGLPQDVAEAVAWLAQPGTGAFTGQALRVCGQSVLGA